MTLFDLLVIAACLLLLVCGFLFWPVLTLRSARRDRRTDEDAVFLKQEPKQFQSLITLETLGDLSLILGASCLLFGLVFALIGWLSQHQTAVFVGIVLSIPAVLFCIASILFQKRAKKQRTALRAVWGTKNTAADLSLGKSISDDLYERLESNLRIQEDKLQAYDMFLRK